VAARAFDALVLDIDGTLLDVAERIHPRTRVALDRARAAGVTLMLATGRSHGGAREVLSELGLDTPAIVFNGAGVYCPVQDRLIEQTILPQNVVADLLIHARKTDVLPVVAQAKGQFARAARTPAEARVLADFRQLLIVDEAQLPRQEAIRVTLLSEHHTDSAALHAAVQRVLTVPTYLTHFALSALPRFVDSSMQVVDVQPECPGKARAFVVLAQRFGIPASRVVAVGDASNDLPMLRAAGLAVAMGNATDDVKRHAHRIIGDNNSDALATLIEELFLDGS
jgi:Cof subfamily protein (haloacid dehalogenase superfamily)